MHKFWSAQTICIFLNDPCHPCCCRVQVQTHPETRYACISETIWGALERIVGGAWTFFLAVDLLILEVRARNGFSL